MVERQRAIPVEPEPSAPAWITTYGDLVSLLVTFFVLLFTFSTVEPERQNRAKGSLTGAFGIMTERDEQSRPNPVQNKLTDDAKTSLRGQEIPSIRRDYEIETALMRMVQDRSFNVPINVRSTQDAWQITATGPELFVPGSGLPTASLRSLARELAAFFAEEPVQFVVEITAPPDVAKTCVTKDAGTYTRTVGLALAQELLSSGEVTPTRVGVGALASRGLDVGDQRQVRFVVRRDRNSP